MDTMHCEAVSIGNRVGVEKHLRQEGPTCIDVHHQVIPASKHVILYVGLLSQTLVSTKLLMGETFISCLSQIWLLSELMIDCTV